MTDLITGKQSIVGVMNELRPPGLPLAYSRTAIQVSPTANTIRDLAPAALGAKHKRRPHRPP